MIRVGLVCGQARAELDGVAGYVARLAEELPAFGVDPVVVACGGGPDDGARASHASASHTRASHVRVADRWDAGGAVAAGAALARLELDAVHVQFAPSMYGFRGAIGLLPLLLRRRIPLVTTLHEYGSWELPVAKAPPMRPVWRGLEHGLIADRETGFLVPRSDAVVVTNPVHLASLQQRFRGGIAGCHIPIGANVEVVQRGSREECRREVRAQLGLEPGTSLLAFFGFVHPVKGIRYLLEAMTRLAADGERLRLVVVGGFESLALPADEACAFRGELEAQVRSLGLGGRVTFTGFQTPAEVSRWLLASDIGVLPFTAGVTGKSGSLLTMFAHGLPVVVTAGDDEALADGRNCIAVPAVRDAGALAAGLRRVLHDDGLRVRIAREGKALAEHRSWRDIACRHARLYREVIA